MPCFYDIQDKPLNIEGLYKGQSCFLCVSGPSLAKIDKSKLYKPGVVLFGVNNSPRTIRPHLWCSVDSPHNFAISIWRDPLIHKFVMYGKRNKELWDNNRWQTANLKVNQCPNITYYHDNEHFDEKKYLTEDTINWGNHTDRCECGEMRKIIEGKKQRKCGKCGGGHFGSRSVMLAAVKMIYRLGFKRLFILGADFKMDENNKYAFDQNRTQSSINSNNSTYAALNRRFDLLRPIFEEKKFNVFNCTPDSGLKSFAYMDMDTAIEIAIADLQDLDNERVYGMYERDSFEKKIREETQKINELKVMKQRINGDDASALKDIEKKLKKSQNKLNDAMAGKRDLEQWKA